MPALHAAIPEIVPIERRNMNIWEDDSARSAVEATAESLFFSPVCCHVHAAWRGHPKSGANDPERKLHSLIS
jgi:hypothetical protein